MSFAFYGGGGGRKKKGKGARNSGGGGKGGGMVAPGGNCKGGFPGQELHTFQDCVNAGANPMCCAAAYAHGNPACGMMKGYYINNCCKLGTPEPGESIATYLGKGKCGLPPGYNQAMGMMVANPFMNQSAAKIRGKAAKLAGG